MVYRALNGMNLPSGRRVEAGQWIGDDELTKRSIGWLTRGGHIEREPDEPDDRAETKADDQAGEGE